MSAVTVIELAGVRIELDDSIDATVREAMVCGRYEAQELRALAGALRPDDVVLELGSGIGLLSAWCAQRVGGERVFTFEANPELEPHIRRTWALNGVQPRLEIAMLTEHEGEQDFYIHDAFWASSAAADPCARRVVRVPALAFNEVIHRIDPSLLVMDIEGGEYPLLQFADLHHVTRVVAEIHERQLGREKTDWMMRRFHDWGFHIRRDLSDWEICCLERGAAVEPEHHLSLEEFLQGPWRLGSGWAASCFDRLQALLPPGARWALVDEDQSGAVLQVLPARTRVPFPEQEGQYWGHPADGDAALQALARQRAAGLQFLVFAEPSLWWLDHYAALAHHLRENHRLLAADDRLVAFDLR
jgi:FkbM family methyltransferase